MNLVVMSVVLAVTSATYEFEVRNHQNCHDDYRAQSGDILTVQYDAFLPDGTKFNTTEGYDNLNLVLGDGVILPQWEEGLLGRCAGEEVVMVVTENNKQLFYLMSVDVITRITSPAPTSTHHYGILLHSKGKCAEAKKVKTGSLVTMNTTARIPNLIYLKYPEKFPKSNVPTKIGEKGALGVKVDESVDTVRAGVSQIIQGWDIGIARACEGERRKIMMSVEMAYGTAGAFRVIPPAVPLVLDVDIMKVENFAEGSSTEDLRSPRNN